MTGRAAGIAPWAVPAAAVALLVASLLPVIHAPFFSDDVPGSQVRGYRELVGIGFFDHYVEGLGDFLGGGRPQFLAGIPGYVVLDFMGESPGLYHAFILALTALDAALLYALLRRLRVPVAAAALVIVLAAAWLQLRIYHDSMLSFSGLVQVVFALTLISIWCFLRWLEEGRRRDLAISVGLFVAACAIYEVAYPLCATHLALALTQRRGRQALRASAPFLGVALAFAVASVALRRFGGDVAPGYEVDSGGPFAILRTYAVQLLSPLPNTNLLVDPALGARPTTAEVLAGVWRGLAAAAATAALGLALLRPRPARWAPVVALGAGLYLAPPVLLAAAAKYQTELSVGLAYLPVVMQVFGLALMATAAFATLLRIGAARSRAMAIGVLLAGVVFVGLTAGVTGFNNVRVVAVIQPDRAARELVESGVAHGVLDSVPRHASVFFSERDMAWQGPTPYNGLDYLPLMIAQRSGRPYDARVVSNAAGTGRCPASPEPVQPACAPPRGAAAWARVRLRRDGGTVVVAPLDRATATGYPRAAATRLVAYRSSDDGGVPDPPRLIGSARGGAPWSSGGVSWRRLRAGDGWALYAAELPARPRPVASSIDDSVAFVDWLAMPPPAERVRLLGTRQLLP